MRTHTAERRKFERAQIILACAEGKQNRKEVYVILDNFCTHKRNDEWLHKYGGRAQLHFTPTSASWLNQIEIWFGLLSRKALKNTSFASKQELNGARLLLLGIIKWLSHLNSAAAK